MSKSDHSNALWSRDGSETMIDIPQWRKCRGQSLKTRRASKRQKPESASDERLTTLTQLRPRWQRHHQSASDCSESYSTIYTLLIHSYNLLTIAYTRLILVLYYYRTYFVLICFSYFPSDSVFIRHHSRNTQSQSREVGRIRTTANFLRMHNLILQPQAVSDLCNSNTVNKVINSG
jgi:hypothetical protein